MNAWPVLITGRSETTVVPPRPTIMPHSNRPAMPQVTAVDNQFGTHKVAPETGTVKHPRLRRAFLARPTRGLSRLERLTCPSTRDRVRLMNDLGRGECSTE